MRRGDREVTGDEATGDHEGHPYQIYLWASQVRVALVAPPVVAGRVTAR